MGGGRGVGGVVVGGERGVGGVVVGVKGVIREWSGRREGVVGGGNGRWLLS